LALKCKSEKNFNRNASKMLALPGIMPGVKIHLKHAAEKVTLF